MFRLARQSTPTKTFENNFSAQNWDDSGLENKINQNDRKKINMEKIYLASALCMLIVTSLTIGKLHQIEADLRASYRSLNWKIWPCFDLWSNHWIKVVYVYQGQVLSNLQGQLSKLDIEKLQAYQKLMADRVVDNNESIQNAVKKEILTFKNAMDFQLTTLKEHSRLVTDIISQFDDYHRSLARAIKPKTSS